MSENDANKNSLSFLMYFCLLIFTIMGSFFLFTKFKRDTKAIATSTYKEYTKNSSELTIPTNSKQNFQKEEKNEIKKDIALQAKGEKKPNAWQKEIDKAVRLLDTGDVQGAVATLEQILQSDPQNEQALLELAMIHVIDLKDNSQAQSLFERALRINPDNKVALSELLTIYDETDQLEAGTQYLSALYEDKNHSPTVARALGQMYMGQDRTQEAIPFLEEGAKSGEVENIVELADAYAEVGMTDKALEAQDRAIDATKDKMTKGDLSEKQGQEILASIYMDKLSELKSQPNNTSSDKIKEITAELKALGNKNPSIQHFIEQMDVNIF